MKYIIKWDIGQGTNTRVVEAGSFEDAEIMAYEAWHEDAQHYADYSTCEYSDEEWAEWN